MSIDSNYDKSSSGHKELFDFDNNMASGNNIQCIDISILDELNKITSENVDTSVKEIPLPLFVPTKSEELVI